MIDARTAPYAAFLLRLSLGVMWLSHALLKLFVFTPAGFAGYLGSLGFSPLFAWPVILAELVFGTAILLGFFGRQASLLAIPQLLVILYVHSGNGWVFSAAGGGWEFPAYLVVLSLIHGLLGDGAFALRPSARLLPNSGASLQPAE